MALLKLSSEYDAHYRPHADPRPASTLRRDARLSLIPGAFQMTPNGDWWVDTETHDRIIAERIQIAQMEQHAYNDPGAELSPEEQALVDEIQGKISASS